jgi:hypothetical protein
MGGRVNRQLSQHRLVALLREATGIDEVKPDRRPGTGAIVRLDDAAIRTESTQRILVQHQDDSLALFTFPAELKPQAEALYRTGRAQRLMDFVAEHPGAWQAMPNLQLAFWKAPVDQRLFFPGCRLDITEYVHRWSGNDFAQVRAYRYDEIRESLWPWLRERQYAGPQDDQQLDVFLSRLSRLGRDAHLRPGIKVRRIWPRAQAVDLDERGALVGEVRAAVTELLTVLDEPLPPAHTEPPALRW